MPDENGKRPDRTVNSDIHSTDSSVLKTERIAILSQLRLLYCVIERREYSGGLSILIMWSMIFAWLLPAMRRWLILSESRRLISDKAGYSVDRAGVQR